MNINANFNQRTVVHSQPQAWVASPMPGVDRRPLDRVGNEIARATSIVRYAPGSKFSPHTHFGGEEFIVLTGVFQDEHGDYPAGSYIRNPPQSSHQPGSQAGCIIFVKLWQFDPDDRQHVNLTARISDANSANDRANFLPPTQGKLHKILFQDRYELVSLYEIAPHHKLTLNAQHGLELLVLDGAISEGNDTLLQQSWLRLPEGSVFKAKASKLGARLWIKTKHLPYVDEQIARLNFAD